MVDDSSSLLKVVTFILAFYSSLLSTWNFYKANWLAFDLALFPPQERSLGENFVINLANFQKPLYVDELSLVAISDGNHTVVEMLSHRGFISAGGTLSLAVPSTSIGGLVPRYARLTGRGRKTKRIVIDRSNISVWKYWWLSLTVR